MPLPLLGLAIPSLIGLGGQLLQGFTGRSAASNAAQAQQAAANQAGQQVTQAGEAAAGQLGEAGATAQQGITNASQAAQAAATHGVGTANETLRQTLAQQQGNLQPYQQAGQQGLAGLQAEANQPGFKYSIDDFRNDPSYQGIIDEGNQAIERAAAARGGLGGGTLKAIARFTVQEQNRQYGTSYDRAERTFRGNQANRYQTLSALTGVGQTATGQANQALGAAGTAIAGNEANLGEILGRYGTNAAQQNAEIGTSTALNQGRFRTDAAQRAGEYLTQGANAQASGIIGRANATGNMIGGLTNIGVDMADRIFANPRRRPNTSAPRTGSVDAPEVWT